MVHWASAWLSPSKTFTLEALYALPRLGFSRHVVLCWQCWLPGVCRPALLHLISSVAVYSVEGVH